MFVCKEDWLEIYNIYKDGTEKVVGRYCGMTAPGPLESNRGAIGLKVLLHTNSEGVSSGFKARYFFDDAKSIFGGKSYGSLVHLHTFESSSTIKTNTCVTLKYVILFLIIIIDFFFVSFQDCGSNISNADSGKVQSPNFPLKYTAPEKGMPSRTCNWFINVRPNYKILLNFVSFSVEGEPASK